MNNDSKLIFEAYLNKQSLLNELDYGASDFGGAFGGVIKKAKSNELPGRGYLIGNIADSLGISQEEAANKLTSAVFSSLFRQNKSTIAGQAVEYVNPAKNKDQFMVEVKKAITKAIDNLKKENPQLKIPGSDAIKGYTARVLVNLGTFISDVVPTQAGIKAPVAAVKDLRSAIVKTDAKLVAPVESTEDKYVRSNAKFIRDFQRVYAEMPDEIMIKRGDDFYKSEAFMDAVKDAIIQAYDVKTSNDKEFLADFVSSLETKSGYTLSTEKKEAEGEGSGEISTIEDNSALTPVEILQDLGTWSRDSGFDQYDKYSSY
jgi:hypothetical protein